MSEMSGTTNGTKGLPDTFGTGTGPAGGIPGPRRGPWTTREIVVGSVLAVASGFLFWGWGLLWSTVVMPFIPFPFHYLLAGTWMLGGIIVPYVIRRPGAALLGELVAAFVSMLPGNQWGVSTMLSGLVQGVGSVLLAILAAGTFGSEFSWGTLRTILLMRADRVRLLIAACSWAVLAVSSVAMMVSLGHTPYWGLVLGGLAIGMAQSPSQPARAALVFDLVGRENLSNANALNAMAINVTQVVGPALGGGVLAPAVAALDPQNPAPAVFEAERGERRLFVTVSGFYDDEGAMLGRIVTAVDISSVRRMALEKARFTRTLVHELRAPLGALKSIVEVMRDRSLGDDLGPYLSFLDRADERIDGLGELISDLLSLSRIEHEGAPRRPDAPADTPTVVGEVVELWRDRASARSVRIEVDLAPELPPCTIPADDLRTLLTNLVGNAVKYNRASGSVTVRAGRSGEGLEIAVSDTGIGIEPGNLARLGEEFFREKRKETRGVEGNGLGLAIVRRLVERAGGRLAVRSRPGEGSEFRVIFPC